MTTRHTFACLAALAVVATFTSSLQVGLRAAGTTIQSPTLQATLAADVAQMGEKFVGLARVMDGKYDWRPGTGVRSVGEVLNLIVGENRMLTGLLAGTAGGGSGGGMGGRGQAISEPAAMQEALRTTYATLQQTIAGLPDSELSTAVRMFGQDTTKRGAILMLLGDQHEHLGQSIAYARMNGIAPPWSRPMN